MADKLISFSELVKEFNTHCGGDCEFCDHYLRVHGKSKTRCLILNSLRAADAVPVVHARWVDPCINKYGHPCHHCSACRFKASQKDRNYCPNCGAKMDGGASDGSDG